MKIVRLDLFSDIEIFFEKPLTLGVVPSVAIQSLPEDRRFVSAGMLDISKLKTAETANVRDFNLDRTTEITSAHWSLYAMVRLIQDHYKKMLNSSDPSAIARLAAESAPAFREFDGRNADWKRDMLILSLTREWEDGKATQAEMFAHAEANNVIAIADAVNGSKWLATRIARLRKKYAS